MICNSLKLIPYPHHVNDYFYLIGTHFLQSNNLYYQSFSLNKFNFISFDKTRNLYEKISKKEFLDKKKEFDIALRIANNVKGKIQLSLF